LAIIFNVDQYPIKLDCIFAQLIFFVFLCLRKILKMKTFKSIWLWWGNTFLC